MVDIKQHNSNCFKLHKKISEVIKGVTKDFLEQNQLSSFTYTRIFPGQYYMMAGDLVEPKRCFFEHHLESMEAYMKLELKKLDGASIRRIYIPWSSRQDSSLLAFMGEKYDIGCGISIFDVNATYIDAYHFAGSSDQDALYGFYQNNKWALDYFIEYFKAGYQKELNSLSLQNHWAYEQGYKLELPTFEMDDKKVSKKKLIDMYPIKSIIINNAGEDYKISKRHAQVMALKEEGLSYKEISNLLGLSKRTVEHYFYNLKEDLNLYSSEKLRELLHKNPQIKILGLG